MVVSEIGPVYVQKRYFSVNVFIKMSNMSAVEQYVLLSIFNAGLYQFIY